MIGLSLYNNQITNFLHSFCKHCGTLDYLYLHGNSIPSIPADIGFPEVNVLRILHFSSNQIEEIPECIFKNLSRLSIFYINSNKLVRLPNDTCLPCDNNVMATLHFQHNKIPYIPKGFIKCMNHLNYLNIYGNRLKYTIPPEEYPVPNRLQHIHQPYNLISGSLRENFLCVINMEYLTSVQLYNNKISGVPNNTGLTLQNMLTWLYLHNNLITFIPNSFFANMTVLKYLYLHSNLLISLPDFCTDNVLLPNLLYLHLHRTNVHIFPNISCFKETLIFFSIGANYLREIPITVFLYSNETIQTFQPMKLNIFQVHDNYIQNISTDIFKIMPYLTELAVYSQSLKYLADIGVFNSTLDKFMTSLPIQITSPAMFSMTKLTKIYYRRYYAEPFPIPMEFIRSLTALTLLELRDTHRTYVPDLRNHVQNHTGTLTVNLYSGMPLPVVPCCFHGIDVIFVKRVKGYI